ncbi:hypothetical protein G7Z17_g10198 [Cylindrodendrum hubeiense]|uniref:J domain-containing protein n=1 Tax=Cylindrodendrum hubeiense TaxID=595255 RepID=A0A9P5H6E2_9HYPO|nr:hypothetical protein G7Z17_g10198 [Cylindrodendrum hubeiense]
MLDIPPAPRPPAPPAAAPQSLRAASSRFSLNEQFAATRQEYELWDDDASSIFDRVTIASEAGDTDATDRVLVSSGDSFRRASSPNNAGPGSEFPDWDFYDILCLPRDAADLSQDQIRCAYHRLFLLFYPDSYPEQLRPIARQQFLRAQEAFEALIDPARRAQYDLSRLLQADQPDDTASVSYEAVFKEAVRDRLQNGVQTSSDLGIRLDATRLRSNRASSSWQSGSSKLKLLDFALSQSVSIDVPTLRNIMQPQVTWLERLALSKNKKRDEAQGLSQPTIEVTTPTLTVLGSVYGVTGDLSLMSTALLYDRYQPLLPLTIPRHRLIQLVENKLSPLVTLRYRQEFVNHAPPPSSDKVRWIKSAVELESDILPEFCVTSRLYHHIILPDFTEPAVIEASVQSSRHLPRTPPRFTIGARQSIYHGTAFARVDSGDWVLSSNESCRFFTDFSKINPNMFSTEGPLKMAPSMELGFRTGPPERIPGPGSSDSPNSDRGIRGLDNELDTCEEGTWAVSAAATPSSVGGFVRYSKNLSLPFQLPSFKPSEHPVPSSARVEVELCSSTFQDRYLALRNLWSVGRFARLGLEVGVSLHSLHVSVYWSRLGQRLSVPLLIAPQALLSPSIIFWAGALPFTGLAAVQLFLHQRRGRASKSGSRAPRRPLTAAAAQVAISRNRYEADNVTVLLAQPVEARQKRQTSLGGLVILSAKYGVPDSNGNLAGEHVADVTIALAALIDDSSSNTGSRLVLPSSVRKSRIPGFWDPAPDREKTLRVKYSFKGVEDIIEVRGRTDLVLPPPPPPLPTKS